jgi:hypothetical protein
MKDFLSEWVTLTARDGNQLHEVTYISSRMMTAVLFIGKWAIKEWAVTKLTSDN